MGPLTFCTGARNGTQCFFAFTVGVGYSWQFALTAIFLEGILFILLTAFNIREVIVNAIPINLKHAISAGIGLFIAFIGLQNAGLIADDPSTLIALGDMSANSGRFIYDEPHTQDQF